VNTTRKPAVAHVLTIIDPEEGDWGLECPLDPADTDKRCSLISECGCEEAEEGTPCPKAPDEALHQLMPAGWWGVLDHGCWLRECDEMRDAVAELKLANGEPLAAGRYLVVHEVAGGEVPVLEVLAELVEDGEGRG
jgi:hypothetical protein